MSSRELQRSSPAVVGASSSPAAMQRRALPATSPPAPSPACPPSPAPMTPACGWSGCRGRCGNPDQRVPWPCFRGDDGEEKATFNSLFRRQHVEGDGLAEALGAAHVVEEAEGGHAARGREAGLLQKGPDDLRGEAGAVGAAGSGLVAVEQR